MAQADGSILIDTKIDQSGIAKGIKGITTAAAAAFGTLSGYAVKAGMDFEAQMSKVEAISGATGDEIAALTEKAKQMGIDTKYSATESAQALEYMAMAGWKTEDMLNGIDGVMNLAAASGEDLAMVSDIVTDSMTAFGLQAKDAAHFSDVLAMASAASNTDVAMLGESFKYVAPVAGAMKYSIEDVSLALGLMANSGIKASQAGTALRSLLSRMVKPTDEVKDAMKTLGVSLTDAKGNMKPFNEVLEELRTGFGKLSDAQKTQLAASLAGQEGMSGLLAIVNASDEDFAALADQINNADGSAQRMAETMNDNLKGQITLLGSSLEGLGLAIYDGINAPLKEAVKYAMQAVNEITSSFSSGELQGALQSVGSLFGELVKVIINIAKTVIPIFVKALALVGNHARQIAVAVTALAGAFAALKVIKQIQSMMQGYNSVSKALLAHEKANRLALLATNGALTAKEMVVGVLTGKIKLATAAQAAWNAVMNGFGGPLGLVITGVTALTAGIAFWATTTDSAENQIKESLSNLAESYEEIGKIAAETVSGIQESTGILSSVNDSLFISDEEQTNLQKSMEDVQGQIIDIAKRASEQRRSFTEEEIKSLDNLFAKMQEIASRELEVYTARQDSVKDFAEQLAKDNDISVEKYEERAKSILKSAQEEKDGRVKYAYEAAASEAASIQQLTGISDEEKQKRIDAVWDTYEQEVEAAEKTYTDTYDIVSQGYIDKADAFGNYVSLSGELTDQLKSQEDDLAKYKVDTNTKTFDDVAELYNTNSEDILAILTGQKDKQAELYNGLNGLMDETAQRNAGVWLGMAVSAREGGGQLSQQAKDNISAMLAPFVGLDGTMEEQGKNVLLGLINGLGEEIPGLEDASNMSADEIVETLKSYFQINSPSKLMEQMGGYIVGGLQQGLEDTTEISKASEKVGKAVAEGIKKGIQDNRESVLTVARNLANDVLNIMKNAWDIHSPSKKTALFGKYLSQGLAVGLAGETGRTIGVVDANMRKIMNRMQAAVTGEAMQFGMGVRVQGMQNALVNSLKLQGADSDKTLSVTQTNYFNQPVESPAEVARALERQSKKLAKEIN